MKLRPEQLTAQLGKELLPAYLVCGAEPLLIQECCDAIRQHCRRQGFSRQVLHADNQFDWSELSANTNAMSLFAERQLIELRLPSGKPGDAGSKALCQYAEHPSPDNVLLIICGKLDGSASRSKWFKAIEQTGATVQVWPVDAGQLPRWIEQRLRQAGLSADRDAVALLSERVEGNLLAAVQEIEKLKLVANEGHVRLETITEAVADNARFDVFSLADRALAADVKGTIRTLWGLRSEGSEATVILWAISRELRTLSICAEQLAQGNGIERVLQNAGVWDRRKPLIKAALQRLKLPMLRNLMALAEQTDRAIKGINSDNSWDLLLQLSAALAGKPLALQSFTGAGKTDSISSSQPARN